jgi:hypothetical protein
MAATKAILAAPPQRQPRCGPGLYHQQRVYFRMQGQKARHRLYLRNPGVWFIRGNLFVAILGNLLAVACVAGPGSFRLILRTPALHVCQTGDAVWPWAPTLAREGVAAPGTEVADNRRHRSPRCFEALFLHCASASRTLDCSPAMPMTGVKSQHTGKKETVALHPSALILCASI